MYIRLFLTHKEYDNPGQPGSEVRKQMSTILANPAEMIEHSVLCIIHKDVELEAYTDALFQLTAFGESVCVGSGSH